MIILIAIPHMTLQDIFVCILAFLPTGWGILQVYYYIQLFALGDLSDLLLDSNCQKINKLGNFYAGIFSKNKILWCEEDAFIYNF